MVTPGGTTERLGPRASASRSRDEARSRSRTARYDETSQSEITDVQDTDNSFEEEVDNTDRPPYIVRWNDEDWIRLSYDSGAWLTCRA